MDNLCTRWSIFSDKILKIKLPLVNSRVSLSLRFTTTVPLEVAHATQVVFNSILNMKNKSYTSTHLMKRNSMQLMHLNAYLTKYAIQPDSPSSMQLSHPSKRTHIHRHPCFLQKSCIRDRKEKPSGF